jgi:glucose/arabinose dehydrogenase
MRAVLIILALIVAAALGVVGGAVYIAGYAEHATLPVAAGFGPNPQLPPPDPRALPTIHPAKAVGWPAGGKPIAHAGLQVAAFARDLDHPRWLYVLPNGDVLAAETFGPADKPDDAKGVVGTVAGMITRYAGATGGANANRITLLRPGKDGDAIEKRAVFLSGLNAPFGMVLVGDRFYVADTDAVLSFPYHDGDTEIHDPGTKLVDLPAGTINHHWTKDITASADGAKLYVSVGSNSNVGENGMAAEEGRAAIWEIDRMTGAHRIFASGLRNPNGLSWEPESGVLWAAVNERDEIGSDLVPDYMTSVKDGAFYGWPYSYYGQHVDIRVQPPRSDLVAKAIAPDYALGPHTASLGLTFNHGVGLAGVFGSGVFIGQHGSWNRNPASGYDVLFVPFAGGHPNGAPVDVLTGFLSPAGEAQGRPVGVAFDKSNALLVADDVGNTIWRVTEAAPVSQ